MSRLKKLICIAAVICLAFCLSSCDESDEAKYQRAKRLLAEEKYFEATSLFDELSSYEDSASMSMYTKAIALAENGDFNTALTHFKALAGFRDSDQMIPYYTGRQYESQAGQTSWSMWIAAAEYYDMVPGFLDSDDRAEACRRSIYDEAIHMAGNGEFAQSVEMLGALSDYRDSASLKAYYAAFKLEQDNLYADASAAFTELGDYKNAATQATEVLQRGYEKAETLERAGDQDGATAVFESLGDYRDSDSRAHQPWYDTGVAKREAKDWYAAIQAFEKAGNYSDAETQILETRYQQALYKREQENWEEAAELFASIGEYKASSTTEINETVYQHASAAEEKGDQEEAYRLFLSVKDYKDAFERACKPYYDLAVAHLKAGEWSDARLAFEKAGDYSDAKDQISAAWIAEGSAAQDAQNWDAARAAFVNAGDYDSANERILATWYEEGHAKQLAKDWNGARSAFKNAGDYSDAKAQISATWYMEGAEELTAGNWEKARTAFASAGEYGDAAEQISAAWYAEGTEKLKAEDWNAARAAFESAGSYSDAKDQISAAWYAEGQARRTAGEWDAARAAFKNAGAYGDAEEQIPATWYAEGKAAQASGNWESARAAFGQAGEYSDAAVQIAACWYSEGLEKRTAKDWDSAREAFRYAGAYSDSASQISETTYQEAADLTATDPDGARGLYESLGDYADSAEKAAALYYALGTAKAEAQAWDEAVEAFTRAGTYSDAAQQATATRIREAETKKAAGDWDGAIAAILASAGNNASDPAVQEYCYQKTIHLNEKANAGEAAARDAADALAAITDPDLYSRAKEILRQGNVFRDLWTEQFRAGSTVLLGRYEQDNDPANGPEAISWKVLDVSDGQALLLTEKVIDAMPFMKDTLSTEISGLDTEMVWQRSVIRRWAEETFTGSFSAQEKTLLIEKDPGGLVFIPDNRACREYCGEEDSTAVEATAYALVKDETHHDLRLYYRNGSGEPAPGSSVMWWLRGGAIKEEGYIYPYNLDTIAGVRPAVWISVSAGPTDEWIDRLFPVPEAGEGT